jgi:hypothetical protein
MSKRYLSVTLIILFLTTACAVGSSQQSIADNSNNSNNSSNSTRAVSDAQASSERGTADLKMGGGTVSVEYGRPVLRGRNLESMIEPGQEWRMGSNAPTTLTTDIDLKFGDKVVPKGTYVLKARAVSQRDWVLIIQTEEKGAVAEVPLTFEKADRSEEAMNIDLTPEGNGGRFVLHWGDLKLSTGFKKA